MNQEHKKTWITIAGGIVLVLIVIFSMQGGKSSTEVDDTSSSEDDAMMQDEVKTGEETTPSSGNPPANKSGSGLPVSMAYEEAVEKYEGRRIQFDNSCQASPSKLTYKNGTEIMFDNRSEQPKVISFDDQSKQLLGYSYTVIKMTSPSVPYTVIVSCGESKNVAQITLQP